MRQNIPVEIKLSCNENYDNYLLEIIKLNNMGQYNYIQNPSDPDATYRNKAGKLHRGYAANLEDTVGKNGSVVTNYQHEQNIHSDSRFLQDTILQMK